MVAVKCLFDAESPSNSPGEVSWTSVLRNPIIPCTVSDTSHETGFRKRTGIRMRLTTCPCVADFPSARFSSSPYTMKPSFDSGNPLTLTCSTTALRSTSSSRMTAHGSPTTGVAGSQCAVADTVNCGIAWKPRERGKLKNCAEALSAKAANKAITMLFLHMEHLRHVMFLH